MDAQARSKPRSAEPNRPLLTESRERLVLQSSGTPQFKAAGPDTFCIYGGPGSELGKFQLGFGGPGLPRASQGWTTRDVTQDQQLWQPSTFNSPTGTTAMWAGRTAEQEPGWRTAPGYGDDMDAVLEYRATVSNPSAAQIVDLQFVFNHDSEPGYDFFHVEYESAGTTLTVLRLDFDNKDDSGVFVPVSFPTGEESRLITYAGNDYAGPGGDEIIIRLRATSDGAFSDVDGFWPNEGLAQVDDIQVTHLDGSQFEDFQGAASQFLWMPVLGAFAGDYGDIYEHITDLDECRENLSPVIGFADHPAPYFGGTPGAGGSAEYLPRNAVYEGPPTGGTMSTTWSYGLPLGWVLNYSGGVSGGSKSLDNEWMSPLIDWDLPGIDDDANAIAGVQLRYSVWNHLPLQNGIFFQWYVRGRQTFGYWSEWKNRDIVYYSTAGPRWENWDPIVSDLLPSDRNQVQVKFRVLDLASYFGFPGDDSTVSPCFDNVSVQKYRVGGPVISARAADLFQDSFAQSGGTSVASSQDRDALDVRVDMARNVNSADLGPNEPGDSMIVDVTSVIPGVAISDSLNQIRLHYSLNMNPVFEGAVRGNAPVTESGTGRFGWDQHEGVVLASQSYSSGGKAVGDRYFFDLPDADFMYPGDVLEYYIEAFDDDGNTTTLPSDLTGYDDESLPSPARFDRLFTVRALPSYDANGNVPQILVWNSDDSGDGLAQTMLDDRWLDGFDDYFGFDEYRTLNPSGFGSNGLGSAGAHGATADQLVDYRIILADFADLGRGLMSDGTSMSSNDKSDDIGTLSTWWNSSGFDRGIAHWGDNLALDLVNSGPAGNDYLTGVLGTQFVAPNVRASIGNQTTPRVIPNLGVVNLFEEITLLGGCPMIHSFNQVQPVVTAVASHGFEVPGNPGSSYPSAAAGILNDAFAQGDDRRSLLFPFGFATADVGEEPEDPENRNFLCEMLYLLGWNPPAFKKAGLPCKIYSSTEPGEQPGVRSLEVGGAQPNPFNPSTHLAFTLGRDARGSVRVYNLRGELVRVVAEGSFPAGLNELSWHGKDDRGQTVASGVYIVRYEIDGYSRRQKIAMVK